MKVLMIGATGKYAGLVLPELKKRDVTVVALVRDEGKAREAKEAGRLVVYQFINIISHPSLIGLTSNNYRMPLSMGTGFTHSSHSWVFGVFISEMTSKCSQIFA